MACEQLQKIHVIDVNGRQNSVQRQEARAHGAFSAVSWSAGCRPQGAVGATVVRSARAHRARGPGQGRPSKALGRRGSGRGLSRVAPMPHLREGNEPHSCPHHRLQPGQCPQTSTDSRRCWGWKSPVGADVLPPSAEQFCKAWMPSQLRSWAEQPWCVALPV